MNQRPEKYQVFSKRELNLWNTLDNRAFVLVSLAVQILLIFFAVNRKRSSNKPLIAFTWSLYLLADWVANFGLGLLANSQDNIGDGDADHFTGSKDHHYVKASAAGTKHSDGRSTSASIRAFWAPFFLLHLGGPDTITAFAMEDNELWLRHFLGLFFAVGSAGYVFLLSLPNNDLLCPTLLIFFPGIVKYLERTYALYLASMEGLRDSMLGTPDPGPNYAKLMDEYQSKIDSGIPARFDLSQVPEPFENIEERTGDLDSLASARTAYRLFPTFKGFFAEIMFGFRERAQSRAALLSLRTANDAFSVIEYELGFVYEILFTKGAVVHKPFAIPVRALCSCSIMAAFLVFFFSARKKELAELDVTISYVLLGGAIALDAAAFFMLMTSDMTLAMVCGRRVASWIIQRPPRKRWSESTKQYNLVHLCLPPHQSLLGRIADRPTCWGKLSAALGLQKALNHLKLTKVTDLFNELQYTSHATVSEEMKKFIFQQLKVKSENTVGIRDARMLFSSWGKWVLQKEGYLGFFRDSIEADFDESLLMWHIATTLCFYSDEEKGKGPGSTAQEDDEAVPVSASVNRRLSKQISDYMIYLLIKQPDMMTPAGVLGRIRRFQDTCQEATNFFSERLLHNRESSCPSLFQCLFGGREYADREIDKQLRSACQVLLSVSTAVKPINLKGDRTKSVLFDGCKLAKDLCSKLGVTNRWRIVGEVWVEMLAYAAVRCNGIAHAQRLSKGGELLTFVWFLMAHLGIGEQYLEEASDTRAQLLVEK